MAKAKKNKVRIPKEIGGFAVPKDLRKAGDRLIEKVNTPQGREVMTAGLAMAATAAVAALERQKAKKAEAAKPEPATAKAGDGEVQSPQAVADAIGQAAEMMIGRFFGKKA